jgi:L-amino acid N-acyltransferase YncA
MVIAEDWRGKGLGTILARELFEQAMKRGIEKITVQIAADQKNAIKIFEKLGFIKEATLSKHVTDAEGKKHDLIIMSNNIEMLWERVEEAIKFHERDLLRG